MSPDPQRFGRVFREAEIDRASEELFAAIDAARVQQLLRAQDAEELALLVADQILSPIPSGHREIGGSVQTLVRQISDQRSVVIVGMRGYVHGAAQDREFLQRELKMRRVDREGVDADEEQEDRSGGSSKHRLHIMGSGLSLVLFYEMKKTLQEGEKY